MTNNLKNPSAPPSRSDQSTFAQNIPQIARATNATGNPPAGVAISRPISAGENAGRTAMTQTAIRMIVTDVDQGSATTAANASLSASRASRSRTTERPFTLLSSAWFNVVEVGGVGTFGTAGHRYQQQH